MVRRAPLAAIALAAAVGLLMIGLAGPRLLSGGLLASHDDTVRRLGRGRKPDVAELHAAIASRTAALAIRETGRVRAELGALYLARARLAPPGSRQRAAFNALAGDALRAGLAMAPAQPYGWVQLAHLAAAGAAPAARLDPVLQIAIAVAPAEPRLVLARIDLALAAWPGLAAETRDLIADQVRLAARHAPGDLARIARRQRALALVRELLSDSAELRRRFDHAYLTLS